jgi:hypothetical protein
VTPTVPLESPFWQEFVRRDYFHISLKIAGADICVVVGINGFSEVDFYKLTKPYHQRAYCLLDSIPHPLLMFNIPIIQITIL